MVTLEGIAIGIDPEFKVLSKAYPYVAKRLLTDSSPQLRASLQDLLFKDGDFRWNRLENLLRNASSSQDYDFDTLINQGVEFLFSDRGSFIRDRLAKEIINAVDSWGQRTWFNWSSLVRQQVGLAVNDLSPELAKNTQTVEHLRSIIAMIQETPGYEPIKLVNVLNKIVTKSETQQLGQQVVEGLAQKALARVIRRLFVEEYTVSRGRISLPEAAFRE
jgi:hypothetical protein